MRGQLFLSAVVALASLVGVRTAEGEAGVGLEPETVIGAGKCAGLAVTARIECTSRVAGEMQTIRKSQKIGIFDSAGKLRLGANTRFEWQGGLKLNTWAGVSGYADCGGWLPEDVDSWTYTGRGNSASQVYHSTAGFPTNSKAKIPYEESVWLYSTNGPEPVGDVPANTSVYCTFTVNAQ